MSVICSSHALVELEDLNYRLSMWSYGLSLLDAVPDRERPYDWDLLLSVCIEGVTEAAAGIQAFEAGIRACPASPAEDAGPSGPPDLT